jgi:segregation and condensation protein B
LKDLKICLNEMFEVEVPEKDIQDAIDKLLGKYSSEEYSFELNHIAGGYQFLTKPAYQASIGILLKQQSKRRLSTSALETLSIIAYKQPVTKGDLEAIRGVNCDYSVQKLLEKGLAEIKGKSEAIGRPVLYGTSEKFMEYFGINNLNELPTPKDFAPAENIIGEEQEG